MTRDQLYQNIIQKQTFLCVGLDPDINKFPPHLKGDPDAIFKFCKEIIQHTKDHCVAYKPNLAFFECLGPKGWEILERVLAEIPPNIFTIADAKRGDIGNTSTMYAKTFFEYFNFDAVTIAPYMGEDSITPFLEFKDKWVIVLGLTSNKGSQDFQMQKIGDQYLYETVISRCQKWGNPDNLMFVIGATHPGSFEQIRSLVKDNFFLVPGVGAQGGSLEEVAKAGMNDVCGLLVNSSRGILYAGSGEDYAIISGEKAKEMSNAMRNFL